jgi:hypothetical protein
MKRNIRASSQALILITAVLGGCAGEGGDNIFTTGALGTQTASVDPQCVTLTTRIDALRKEGIADKIEKAAVKKYKMTQTDLNKADQLNKANAEFQSRCSTVSPTSTAQLSTPPATSSTKAGPKSQFGAE